MKVLGIGFWFFMVVLCIWAAWCGGEAAGDTVVLKQGQRITGDILADKEDMLYVDIGVDIVKVPKDQILEYKYSGQESASAGEDVNDANVAGEAKRAVNQLYYTADLPKTSIAKCVERFSESVVKVSTPAGLGSGFFINEDGYLITNYHVIERETRIEVTVFQKASKGFVRKTFKKVRIEAINPFLDLALLKVEELGDTKVSYAYLGRGSDVRVGEKAFAIGNPLGLERTVTDGVISTKNRAFKGLLYLQTNADINPGNSGGPLFNLSGEVVGVTNMGYIFYGGLGFAIPVDYVKRFIENRDAFAYDKDNPNTGYRYIQPERRRNRQKPEVSGSE